MRFDIFELLLTVAVFMLIFGGNRWLPQMGASLGQAVHEFRQKRDGDTPPPPPQTDPQRKK